MIKKRYKTPMAKFHKLNAPAILAGSYGDEENNPYSTTFYSVEEEEKVPTANKGLQW